jgi:hypothetical protein
LFESSPSVSCPTLMSWPCGETLGKQSH